MRLSRLALLSGFVSLSVVLGQNCSKSGFEADGSASLSSSASSPDIQTIGTKVDDSYQLLNHQQILQSLLAATGIDNIKTSTAIYNEFQTREAAFDITGSLKMINAPMILSQTNLASEVCSQLVSKERVLNSSERIIFNSIDFAKPPTAITPEQINEVAQNLARNSWRRPASEVETQVIQVSTTDFVNDFTATEKASSLQTTTVGVFVCTAMLSTFDAMTY